MLRLRFSKMSLYIKLMRLDKPIGIILLFWSCVWGMLSASEHIAHITYDHVSSFVLLFLGSIVLRSLGCVINDIADRELDQKVKRTKHRPLASQQLSLEDAFGICQVLCLIGLVIFIALPRLCKYLAILGALLMVIYPFSKRWTRFPQVFLGLAFATGTPIGYASILNILDMKILFLTLAQVFWIIAYDTIYGFQDLRDDKKAGIHSTSVTFENTPKSFVMGCYGLCMVFLTLTNIACDRTLFEYNVLGCGIWMVIIYTFWNPHEQNNCAFAFKSHALSSVIGVL